MSVATPDSAAESASSPQPLAWRNFARNLYFALPADGGFYVTPTSAQELREVLARAARSGRKVRVSGQRHSQPPLVVNSPLASGTDPVLVDMSCYADLGDGTQRIIAHGLAVTVNTGVREDELDVFLTNNQLMLRTVTAGGFFSIGGMTAVDVHGATIDAPIFAETASSFTIMCADGSVSTIDAQTPAEDGWRPLQFARVSLGALGVVTSVTLDVLPRPHANGLTGGIVKADWKTQQEFTVGLGGLLASKSRLETFFNPYARGWLASPFQACWWNVDVGSGAASSAPSVPTACQQAKEGSYGAPELPHAEEWLAERASLLAQGLPFKALAALISSRAMATIEKQVTGTTAKGSDLWLSWAARVIFMSYFIELPDLGEKGLGNVWNLLQSVRKQVIKSDGFHVAMPLEFRFIRSGDSAMSGTYSSKPGGSYFVNLDLIAVAAEDGHGLRYPDKLKKLFSSVEREWVALGGWPHQGKMYGFYDPQTPAGSYSDPFNPAFVSFIRQRRGGRVQAFNAYRKRRDPGGMFENDFLRLLVGD